MIIAFDQALAHTGWAILRPNEKQVWVGVHSTSSKHPLWNRLESIETLTRNLLFFGEKVVTESVFASPIPLIQVQTTIHLYLWKEKVPFESINSNPSRKDSWRYNIGLQTGDKKAVQVWAENLWNQRLNSHQADALGILWGWAKLKGLPEKPQDYKLHNFSKGIPSYHQEESNQMRAC